MYKACQASARFEIVCGFLRVGDYQWPWDSGGRLCVNVTCTPALFVHDGLVCHPSSLLSTVT